MLVCIGNASNLANKLGRFISRLGWESPKMLKLKRNSGVGLKEEEEDEIDNGRNSVNTINKNLKE
ncbi:hypothetical protein GX48_05194 [Paracoccidioides brasiliensis]|nr:hypothetical protein GX48_05194 [Paracoccidioides brasiliensis]